MKNKRNTYILLVFVLLIWATVIYRFSTMVGDKEFESKDLNHALINKKKVIEKRKLSVINTHYRDPFLGNLYLDMQKKVNRVNKNIKLPLSKESLHLSSVNYKGLVADSKSKSKIFILIINRHTYLLKEKESAEGITFLKGDETKIIVTFNRKKYTIFLEP